MIRLPHDPALPGLAAFDGGDGLAALLQPILATERPELGALVGSQILRIRHREGERAILQCMLDFDDDDDGCRSVPASVWFFAGGKARKRSLRAPGQLFEPVTQSLVCVFPDDPHAPGLAAFAKAPQAHLRRLVPGATDAAAAPRLVRFRPGLGATFRWAPAGSEPVYVKVFAGSDVETETVRLNALRDAADGRSWGVPHVTGRDAALPAMAIGEVRGTTYADILARPSARFDEQPTARIIEALRDFHASAPWPDRHRTAADFVSRARSAADLTGRLCPAEAGAADAIANWIARTPVALGEGPTHCDIKVEHVVLGDGKVVFLDLDSFAVADPLYDLAMLDIRVAMHGAASRCRAETADAVSRLVLAAATAGSDAGMRKRYGWLKACAALQLAKHFAQNAGAEPDRMAGAALALARAGRALHAGDFGNGAARSDLAPSRHKHNRENEPCVSS